MATAHTPQFQTLAKMLAAALHAISEHSKRQPAEADELYHFLASDLRSRAPLALIAAQAVEPAFSLSRDLGDGARYDVEYVLSESPAVVVRLRESIAGDGAATTAMTLEQFDGFMADCARVRASGEQR